MKILRLARAGGLAPRRGMLFFALTLACLTACSNGLDPDEVDVTGGWVLQYELGATDFHFLLEEGDGGLVTGRWSGPSRFAYHNVSGRRQGLTLDLTADSPNIFPMQLTVTMVNKSRMEGHQYYGGQTEKIILRREAVTRNLE